MLLVAEDEVEQTVELQLEARGFLAAWWLGHPMAGADGPISWGRVTSYGITFSEVQGLLAIDVDRAPWNALRTIGLIPTMRVTGMRGFRITMRHLTTDALMLGPEIAPAVDHVDFSGFDREVSRREGEIATWWHHVDAADQRVLGRFLPALTVDTGLDHHGRIPVLRGATQLEISDRGWELFLVEDPVSLLVDLARREGLVPTVVDPADGRAVLVDAVGGAEIEVRGRPEHS